MNNILPDEDTPGVDLLDRYFVGDVTPAELAVVRRWISRYPDGEAALVAMRRLSEAPSPVSWDAKRRWAKLSETLGAEQREFQAGSPEQSRRLSPQRLPDPVPDTRNASRKDPRRVWNPGILRNSIWSIATAAVIAGVLLVSGRQSTPKTGSPSSSRQVSTYTTANGERATVTLSDGTTIVLNVGSRLEVPLDYGKQNHTVRLDGEAFFTVAHKTATPFVVVAGPSTTRVLGTSFVVRHYPTDSLATIAVRDGKVAVRSTVLTGMQQGLVDRNGETRVTAAHPSQFGFVTGVLQFNGTTLASAIPDLNRWYNVNIRLGDPALADRIVVGGFKAGSQAELIAMLEWVFKLRVVQDGQMLTLYGRDE